MSKLLLVIMIILVRCLLGVSAVTTALDLPKPESVKYLEMTIDYVNGDIDKDEYQEYLKSHKLTAFIDADLLEKSGLIRKKKTENEKPEETEPEQEATTAEMELQTTAQQEEQTMARPEPESEDRIHPEQKIPGVIPDPSPVPTEPEAETAQLHTHEFKGAVTTEPTCIHTGIMTYTCTCGASYTEQIPANGHMIVSDKELTPTCTKEGLTAGSHCSICGTVITPQQVIPANGHVWETYYHAWRVVTDLPVYICDGCGAQFVTEQEAQAHISVSEGCSSFSESAGLLTWEDLGYMTMEEAVEAGFGTDPSISVDNTDLYLLCSVCGTIEED